MAKARTNIPFGLLFIAVFYTFGAVILLIFLSAAPVETSSLISEVHGLPVPAGNWLLLFIVGLALLIAYGLFSRSRWGYVLTIVYLAYFGSVSALLLGTHNNSVYLGNLTWSIFVMLYLFLLRHQFQVR